MIFCRVSNASSGKAMLGLFLFFLFLWLASLILLTMYDVNKQNALLRYQATKRNGWFVKGSINGRQYTTYRDPKLKFMYDEFSIYVVLKNMGIEGETNIFVPLVIDKDKRLWLYNKKRAMSFMYMPGRGYYRIPVQDAVFDNKFVVKVKNASVDFVKTLFNDEVKKRIMACLYNSLDIAIHPEIEYGDIIFMEGLHLSIQGYSKAENDYDMLIDIVKATCDSLKTLGFKPSPVLSEASLLESFFKGKPMERQPGAAKLQDIRK